MTALPSGRIPGVADLHAIDLRRNIVVPGAAHDRAGVKLANGPRQHGAGTLALECLNDVPTGLLRLGDGGEPELPQLSVGCGGGRAVPVSRGERLQPDSRALERDWGSGDHECYARQTTPGKSGAVDGSVPHAATSSTLRQSPV